MFREGGAMREVVAEKMKQFEGFAKDWLQAWNSHSLEAVLSHYAENVTVKSPFLAAALPDSGGTVVGKAKLREIYSRALVKYPDLKFELVKIFASTESVVILYRSVENQMAAETFWLDEEGKAKIVLCHYAPGD
jgi:SnoaL-like domain